MTQTPQDTAGSGGQGPRVPPAQMRDLNRLRRSTTDRKIAGVAGGIARHLDIDPTIVRVLLVVLCFFGGAGLLIYGAGWLFVPEDGKDQAPIHLGGDTRTVVLIVALALAAILLLGNGWWWGFGEGWPPPVFPLLVIGLVAWLLLRNRGPRAQRSASAGAPAGASPYVPAQPPPAGVPAGAPPHSSAQPPSEPPPPKPRALFGITMSLALLALGVVAVVEVAGTPLPWALYPATALAVIGVALLVAAYVGRATGLVVTGLVAVLVLAGAVWSPNPRFGDVWLHPVRAEAVQDSYARTAGVIDLDLTGVRNPAALDGRRLALNVRAGEIRVLVPRDLDVAVTSTAQGGELDILGQTVDGRNVVNNGSTPDTEAPNLHIDIDMGFGHVRASRS
ncbi:MAG: DUF6264 family protein [Nocardioidaceae bacterium]